MSAKIQDERIRLVKELGAVTAERDRAMQACEAIGIRLHASERQARSRTTRALAGGKQISIMITPKAAAKLADQIAQGKTISGVVNSLLENLTP